MRYFLHLAYQGYRYRGWQQQGGKIRTVQAVMEDCLSRLLKHKVIAVGCGRTDAQVHASQYILHFNTSEPLSDNFKFVINKMLPDTISVFGVYPVADRAHARYDAVLRQYDYLLHTHKQAFLAEQSALYDKGPIDLLAMKKAADRLLHYEDFRGYCLSPDKHNTTLCYLKHVALFSNEDQSRIRFQISSNRFLRGMIRIIMHRLLEVGWGKIDLDEFEKPLKDEVPPRPLRSAYPEGLYLSKVTYPFLDLAPEVNLAFEKE
jgi:tRNA pseudouridine38-40 synthase